MISLQAFANLLRAKYAPHYAYPRMEPKEALTYFKFGTMSTERNVRSGNVTRTTKVHVRPRVQGTIYRTLAKMKLPLFPYVVAISSYPNEYMATEMASCILLSLLRLNPTLRWTWVTSSHDPNKHRGNDMEQTPHVVILRSIVAEHERIYAIRDILDAYPRSLRIVCLSDVEPFDYFDNYIHYPLSGALNIIGSKDEMPPQIYADNPSGLDYEFNTPVFNKRDIYALVRHVEPKKDRPDKVR